MQAYLQHLHDTNSIFLKHWGDAAIKTIAVALFAPASCVHHFSEITLIHTGVRPSRTNSQVNSTIQPSTDEPRAVFARIYDKALWGQDGGGSGLGSTLANTTGVRRILTHLIERYHISSMLDAPCGSFHWMPEVLSAVRRQQQHFQYIGVDVVDSVVRENSQRWNGTNGTHFQQCDLASDSPQPLPPVDLIFCRDALQHLSFRHISNVLQTFKHADPLYLLVSSYPATPQNKDIATGRCFRVNLMIPPFSLVPDEIFSEEWEDVDNKPIRHVLLFSRVKIQQWPSSWLT